MNARNGMDPAQLDRLAQQVIDPFRSVELELSRELQVLLAKENIRSAQEEEIPEGNKKLVEEYYNKLSNQKQNKATNDEKSRGPTGHSLFFSGFVKIGNDQSDPEFFNTTGISRKALPPRAAPAFEYFHR